jgi:hypothetical protein
MIPFKVVQNAQLRPNVLCVLHKPIFTKDRIYTNTQLTGTRHLEKERIFSVHLQDVSGLSLLAYAAGVGEPRLSELLQIILGLSATKSLGLIMCARDPSLARKFSVKADSVPDVLVSPGLRAIGESIDAWRTCPSKAPKDYGSFSDSIVSQASVSNPHDASSSLASGIPQETGINVYAGCAGNWKHATDSGAGPPEDTLILLHDCDVPSGRSNAQKTARCSDDGNADAKSRSVQPLDTNKLNNSVLVGMFHAHMRADGNVMGSAVDMELQSNCLHDRTASLHVTCKGQPHCQAKMARELEKMGMLAERSRYTQHRCGNYAPLRTQLVHAARAELQDSVKSCMLNDACQLCCPADRSSRRSEGKMRAHCPQPCGHSNVGGFRQGPRSKREHDLNMLQSLDCNLPFQIENCNVHVCSGAGGMQGPTTKKDSWEVAYKKSTQRAQKKGKMLHLELQNSFADMLRVPRFFAPHRLSSLLHHSEGTRSHTALELDRGQHKIGAPDSKAHSFITCRENDWRTYDKGIAVHPKSAVHRGHSLGQAVLSAQWGEDPTVARSAAIYCGGRYPVGLNLTSQRKGLLDRQGRNACAVQDCKVQRYHAQQLASAKFVAVQEHCPPFSCSCCTAWSPTPRDESPRQGSEARSNTSLLASAPVSTACNQGTIAQGMYFKNTKGQAADDCIVHTKDHSSYIPHRSKGEPMEGLRKIHDATERLAKAYERSQGACLQSPDEQCAVMVLKAPDEVDYGTGGKGHALRWTEARHVAKEWDMGAIAQPVFLPDISPAVHSGSHDHIMIRECAQSEEGLTLQLEARDKSRATTQHRSQPLAEAREAWPSAQVHPLQVAPLPLTVQPEAGSSCMTKPCDKLDNAAPRWKQVRAAMVNLQLFRKPAAIRAAANRPAYDSLLRTIAHLPVTARLQSQRVASKALWDWHETAGLPADLYVWNCLELVMLAEYPSRAEVCYGDMT